MTFKTGFAKYACEGDTITCTVDGYDVAARIERDNDTGAPWEAHDGHGPVTEWTSRAKRAGERVLAQDRGSFRYYDFAEAVRIAKRDGWGPGTPAEAVEADYRALRAWSADEWFWCGIVLSVSRNGVVLDKHAASLWGIDCNHPNGNNAYLLEVANELLPEALEAAKAIRAKLCA